MVCVGRQAKRIGNHSQQVVGPQLCADQHGDIHLIFPKTFHKIADKGRFARAGLARNHHKAFGALKRILHVSLGFGVTAVVKAEPMIRT